MAKGNTGLVVGLIVGIAALVITIIIAFVIVSNVATVGDSIAADIPGVEVINESSWVNATGYTLTKASLTGFASPVITTLFNTTSGASIPVGNVSVTSAGVVTNATSEDWHTTLISYTYTYTPTVSSANSMISNFTAGVDNVSSKIPTILLIAVVVLVLGVLVLLWTQYQRMNIGGGSEL